MSSAMMSIHLLRRQFLLLARFNPIIRPIRPESQKAASNAEDNEPVKFSESDAHLKWKARYNYVSEEEYPYPPSFRTVALTSIFSFMIYFFYLREENDIDERIYQPLWKTVPELEIPLFEAAVKQHREHNLPHADLEAHLRQALQRDQQMKKQSGTGGGKN